MGTTLVAAQNLGFEYIGCEINKDYYEVAKKQTGRKEKSVSMRINTVINGDCLKEMFDIPNKSINAIISDIPYGVAYETRGTKNSGKRR